MDPADMLRDFDMIEALYLSRIEAFLEAEMDRALQAQSQTAGSLLVQVTAPQQVQQLLAPLWEMSAQKGVSAAEALLGLKSDFLTSIISTFVSGFGRRSSERVAQTTPELVRQMIARGQLRGQDRAAIIAELTNRIPDLARARAQTIVRTELHAAHQFASQQRAMQSGLTVQKVWFTVLDERTRDFGLSGRISQFNHRVMHNTRVPLTAFFNVPSRLSGSEALLFPGDPSGSPGNIINCRCVQTYERV